MTFFSAFKQSIGCLYTNNSFTSFCLFRAAIYKKAVVVFKLGGYSNYHYQYLLMNKQ